MAIVAPPSEATEPVFTLEAQESRPSSPAMRSAAAFAHYLRRSFDMTAPDNEELVAWQRVYGSNFQDFAQTIAECGRIRRESFSRRWNAWSDKYRAYRDSLNSKDITWGVRRRREMAWLRRNSEPTEPRRSRRIGFCTDCDQPRWPGSVGVVGGQWICISCRNQRWLFCDRCGDWYRRDSDHYHPPVPKVGSNCHAPQQRFRFPNRLLKAGYQPHDRIVEVRTKIKSGRVSPSAMVSVRALLNETAGTLHSHIDRYEFGNLVTDEWQTREGNFPKRLANKLYRGYGRKLTAEQVSLIGNLAKQNMAGTDTHFVEFTRVLGGSSATFRNDGSCWWTHSEGNRNRCLLKVNAGMAMRTFENLSNTRSYPLGRSWVIPLDDSNAPVHNPMEATRFLLFNSYGRSGQEMSSLLAMLTGKEHVVTVDFFCTGMYINGGSAYLVSDERYEYTPKIYLPITQNEIRCSCVTHEKEPADVYPYDDSDYDPAMVIAKAENKVEATTYDQEEEEEPEDDGDLAAVEARRQRPRFPGYIAPIPIHVVFDDEPDDGDF